MANLQIKGMSDDFYAQIKALASSENRSVSQQILFMTKEYLLKKQQVQAAKMPAQALLEFSGAWEDDRTKVAPHGMRSITTSRSRKRDM